MLNLDKLNKLVDLTVIKVIRDKNEPDKIKINIDAIVYEAVMQHAAVLVENHKESAKIPELCKNNTIRRNGYKDCTPSNSCPSICPNNRAERKLKDDE